MASSERKTTKRNSASRGPSLRNRSKYWRGEASVQNSKLSHDSDSSDDNQQDPEDEEKCHSKKNSETKHLDRSFFDVSCVDLAKKLLGQRIVRKKDSQCLSGRIVETEAYLGLEDKAAHSYKGKQTPRNMAMFMEPGTSYVYNIYGMYRCLNISSKGDGCAVLIRALEVMDGQDVMREYRKPKNSSKTLKDKELANGPSKLCQALDISKDGFNQIDLTSCDNLWLEGDTIIDSSQIVSSARINIGYAEDWKDKPLRFYILGNGSVSVRDKKAELEILNKIAD